ncbi:MAG: HPP family protein [Desulfitobacterium sp.]
MNLSDSAQIAESNQKRSILIKYLIKFKGHKRITPLVSPAPIDILITLFGTMLGISFLSILLFFYKMPMLAASLGASAVLVYGVPDAPLSQPRNVIFGHTFSASIGVLAYQVFGTTWWSVTLGTALALFVMLLTKTTHPPGGATAMFAVLNGAGPMYIVAPMLLGSAVLVLIAVLVNNLSPNRNYPRYWY